MTLSLRGSLRSKWWRSVALFALGVHVLVLPVRALADPGEKHSGTLAAVKIGPRTTLLVLEEMVEEAETRLLTVLVTPGTAVMLSQRLPDHRVRDLQYPFRDNRISLSDLRLGDFIVVDLSRAAEDLVAHSITVTFRAEAESPGVKTRRHPR